MSPRRTETQYVPKAGIEIWSSCLHIPSSGIADKHHHDKHRLLILNGLFYPLILKRPLLWCLTYSLNQSSDSTLVKELIALEIMEELGLSLALVPSLRWFQIDVPIVFLGDSFGYPCFYVWLKQTFAVNIHTTNTEST